ncbi:hypothetical protein [uncultured Cellulomonas sp.]|uniref:hypothetical protein n=1 Tax=uncultured Cellulomonas sp. TaxID=189682 RepID=UPI002604B0C5|nr:hypothetical protein [uncultured Cellulomonas sp.]
MRSCGRTPRRARTAVLVVLAALLTGVLLPAAEAAGPDGPTATVPAPSPVDPFAPYVGQTTCDPTAKPGARAVLRLAMDFYRIGRDTGISRSCSTGGQSEHKEGRAFDWGLRTDRPAEKAAGDAFTTWLTAAGPDGKPGYNARRLGVMYVIWDRRIWTASTAMSTGWRPYNGAVPHTDHVHVSLSWNGAHMRTSWWTGSLTAQKPIGYLDGVSTEGRSVTVQGWALDPDTSASTDVHVYVDGAGVAQHADLSRPDVAAVHGRGDRHGFAVTFPGQEPGPHEVCVYAIDSSGVGFTTLGCRTVAVANAAPVGHVDTVESTASSATVTGWTLDPDTTAPSDVRVLVDGAVVAQLPAQDLRPDVQAVLGRGDRHGFTVSTPLAPGLHELCVDGVDTESGAPARLACRSVGVAVQSAPPIGHLDGATPSSVGVTVAGWSLDPDSSDPTRIRVEVGGAAAWIMADRSRPDVAAALGTTDRRGFRHTASLPPGTHRVCVSALNTGVGPDTLLGCRDVTVPNEAPFGFVDSVRAAPGQVSVSGWALDPDSLDPTDVRVSVDGVVAAVRSDLSRPDVGAVFRRGDRHGFAHTRSVAPGRHTVCVEAVDTASRAGHPVACREVDVPA